MTKKQDLIFISGLLLGEPEIIFHHMGYRSKTTVCKMRMWEGFFSGIIELIQPNRQGFYEGVPHYYHTHTGFYEKLWECEEKDIFLTQLKMINTRHLRERHMEVHREMTKMLEACIAEQEHLWIEYSKNPIVQ